MVSIIVPVYNVESYLRKCLDSCFQQTFANIEVIAVNDGSNDDSGNILDEYALKEPRLKVFHQLNAGTATARKNGIDNSSGEWLIFVDSDDYIPNDAVFQLYNSAIENDAEIVVGEHTRVYKNKSVRFQNTLPYGKSKSGIASALLTGKIHFTLCGKIYRKELFSNIHMDLDLKIGEDAYILMQLYDKANNVFLLDACVYCYLYRHNSVTNKPSSVAVALRLKFVQNTIDFYSSRNYFCDPVFQKALNCCVLDRTLNYLMVGGEYDMMDKDLRQRIEIILKDKHAHCLLPFWKARVLKTYKVSPCLGRLATNMVYATKKLRAMVKQY